MKFKKFLALTMACMLSVAALAGCGGGDKPTTGGSSEPKGLEAGETYEKDEIVNYTMFIAMPGSEINDGNEIQNIIAEKTGVKVKETWLTGQTAAEAVGSILASGDLPDFIDGGDGMMQLYDAGVLVPWDEYIEKYPNIKELYSDEEWESFRQKDGHIYWANVFCNTYGESMATGHNDEAFWIQCRVLEWAGYPEIKTLDQYFDLLERYAAANPTMEDGTPVIPYTMLCEDWRYFCIENAPEFLAGYPNDGSVIVDTNTMKIVDYNTIPEAKEYFSILNEEYSKGIIDTEFATQTYDEYIAKLSTGRVLGMCDQWWDFAYTVNDIFVQQNLDDIGCNYVPLGLTLEEGKEQMWHVYGDTLNNSSGVAVTTSCADPDRAFRFLNDVLDQEIHDLRFWGVEGVDYLVDEDGMYYRTQEMRDKWADSAYQAEHRCVYSYLPQWLGTSHDGKNAMQPQEQASEFFAGLADPLVKCFEAYGAHGYPDMIGSVVKETGPWYPMYSYSNSMTTETPGGVAWTKMGEVKHEWLPKVVMASNFDKEWDAYMKAYSECKPEDFIAEMQEELDRRAGR
ncbi:MAG: sugar ABC transporter substrate-binding protein [Lachnospiraceae bacterium]